MEAATLALLATTAYGVEVDFLVTSPVGAPYEEMQGELRLWPPGSDSTESSALTVSAHLNELLKIKVDSRTSARFALEGVWSEKVDVDPDEIEQPVKIRTLPGSDVAFLISAEEGLDLPETIDVRFSTTPEPEKEPTADTLKGATSCRRQDRTLRCFLPGVPLDLVFSPDGLASFFVWGLDPASDKLPVLHLKAGGNVWGRVVDSEGNELSDVEVALVPPVSSTNFDPVHARRLLRMAPAAETGERGYFQIGGVPEGTYRAILTKEGFARKALPEEAFFVEQRSYSLGEDIQMNPTGQVWLEISPATQPDGQPWSVFLHPHGTTKQLAGKSAEATLEATGVYLVEDLPAGLYSLMIESSEGDRRLVERLEILEGVHTLSFDLGAIRVLGSVLSGDTPVLGSIELSRNGLRVTSEMDDEGRFEIAELPQAGCWSVTVFPGIQGELEIALPCVDVEPVDGSAELEIALDDTRLEGQVVDSLGSPVENAKISIFPIGDQVRPSSVRSDSEGEFVVPGLPEGNLMIKASLAGKQSEHVEIRLREGESHRQVLTIRDEILVYGQVMYRQTPVSGARVVLWPDATDKPGVSIHNLSTDFTGTFEGSVSEDTRSIHLIVKAPGFGTKIAQAEVRPDEPIWIELDLESGELLIELPPSADMGKPLAISSVAVVHEGVSVPLPLLQLVSGDRLSNGPSNLARLGTLAQGTYTACQAGATNAAEPRSVEVSAPVCSSVYLPPGGTATISLISK